MSDQRRGGLSQMPEHQYPRRTLLQGLGIGALLGSAGLLRQPHLATTQNATQPTPPPRRLPGGPTVEDKVVDLAYDPELIFRFVADEITYEAYPGALRGGKGTLWGLAGNSVDQALLLAEMLT